MSPKSLVFSHQRDTAISLAELFDSVTVFTTEKYLDHLPKNVRVHEIAWEKSSPVKNMVSIMKAIYPFLLKNRKSVLFSHMTDVHAALVSPLARLLGMRHILWYAHAKNSLYLIWSSFFVTQIVSSTPGSCNLKLKSKKVTFINQGISQQTFPFHARALTKLQKIIYYGRLDPSKNIHLLFKVVEELRAQGTSVTLDIFGKPSNSISEDYLSTLKASPQLRRIQDSISLHDSISRDSISKIANNFDVFLNLFSGSLDKALIEATLMGLPVVTWNSQYSIIFGTWSKNSTSESITFLVEEFNALALMTPQERIDETSRRFTIALEFHSFDGWIKRLASILKEGKN
jgi:glycosyltransferase involved in cell wall biosynthesis